MRVGKKSDKTSVEGGCGRISIRSTESRLTKVIFCRGRGVTTLAVLCREDEEWVRILIFVKVQKGLVL